MRHRELQYPAGRRAPPASASRGSSHRSSRAYRGASAYRRGSRGRRTYRYSARRKRDRLQRRWRGQPAPDGLRYCARHPRYASRSRNRVRPRQSAAPSSGSPRADRHRRHREKPGSPPRPRSPPRLPWRRPDRNRAPLDQHRCSGGARLCDGAVAAAAIDDDDLIDPAPRHRRDHRADRPFLVKNRNDYAAGSDIWPALPAVHRLQRTPHEAQAGGGFSLSNARRNSW